MTLSPSKQLATWDATRQQAYRATHPDSTFIFHLLLDASGSMCPHEAALRSAYNMYLSWLQRHGPPMALVDTRWFASTLQAADVHPLGNAKRLHAETYSAGRGGTALYDAIGAVVTQAGDPGQHILVVFTDGVDYDSEHWTAGQVQEVLTTMQTENQWLCVFLGAFPQALQVARTLGFTPGNCLVFGSEKIPEAFARLRAATETYLLATPPERKLLAQRGVFHHEPRRMHP
jgi:hypothetical protein